MPTSLTLFAVTWLGVLGAIRWALSVARTPAPGECIDALPGRITFPRIYKIYYLLSLIAPLFVAVWCLFALPDASIPLQRMVYGRGAVALFSPDSVFFIAPCGAFLGPVIFLVGLKLLCSRFCPSFDAYRVLRYRESYSRIYQHGNSPIEIIPDGIPSLIVPQIIRGEWGSILRPLFWLWFCCGPLYLIGFDTFVRITPEGVMINRVLSLGREEQHGWSEIRAGRLEIFERREKEELFLEPLFAVYLQARTSPVLLWHSFGFGLPTAGDIIRSVRTMVEHGVPAEIVPLSADQRPLVSKLRIGVRKMVLEVWNELVPSGKK